jgi:hypothetical protein
MPSRKCSKLIGISSLLTALIALSLRPVAAVAEDPPKGQYLSSCVNAALGKDWEGNPVLTASCQNYYNQPQDAVLLAPLSCPTVHTPTGDLFQIYNVNGALRCNFQPAQQDPSGHQNWDWIGKTTWTDDAKTIQKAFWTIDQPNIARPLTPYPMITYEAGDTLILYADGCAQSGGHGNTWKRYVNPSGDSSGPPNGEYFGLVLLPNTDAPAQQQPAPANINVIGQRLFVYPNPVHPTEKFSLQLGYVDDGYPNGLGGYDDNGYYSHDEGDNGQCTSSLPQSLEDGPAWVSLEIDHPLKAVPAPYSLGSKPFDVIFNQMDASGLPLNPKWNSQRGDKPGNVSTQFFGGGSGVCTAAFSTPSHYSAAVVVSDIGGAAAGAEAGAAVGSALGPVGSAAGAVVGAIGGWLFGSTVPPTNTTVDAAKLAADCTSQPASVDQFSSTTSWGSAALEAASLFKQICPADPIRGHLNMEPVTYTGMLHFNDWSGVFPQDYDLNLSLVPGTAGDNGIQVGVDTHNNSLDTGKFEWGLTQGSDSQAITPGSEVYPYGGFLVEFDSQETTEKGYFLNQPVGSFWRKFSTDTLAAGPSGFIAATGSPSPSVFESAIVDANDLMGASTANPSQDSDPPVVTDFEMNAVVTGLMGIDGVHSHGISELHPVFSMAIHVPPDDYTSTGKTEHWEYFIRNQGDEGNCAAQTHTLEPEIYGSRDYYISLPWPSETGKPVFESVSTPRDHPIKATPWVSGASVEKVLFTPGLGTFLHFLSPPYSTPSPVPFFGFIGDVDLEYQYAMPDTSPNVGKAQISKKEPGASPKREKESETYDAEDFPVKKIIAASTDPATTKHLTKYFASKTTHEVATAPLPALVQTSSPQMIAPKSMVRDARLPRRTHELVNVSKQKESDDLYRAIGHTRRTFQAVDAQHVYVLGRDGILRLKQGPFSSVESDQGKMVDYDVQNFEAGSPNQVFKLGRDGALFVLTTPFGPALDGKCAKGYVWREAYKGDHVCVSTRTHDDAALDNAAAKDHVVSVVHMRDDTCKPGYVWRQAKQDDHICVTPDVRSETAEDNARGPVRVAGAASSKFFGWPVAEVQATSDGGLVVLDANGKLFSATAPLNSSNKPTFIAKDVRAFQAIDSTHMLVLSTNDRLQLYPVSAPIASPKVYEKVWAFQQTNDGSLFVVDEDDTLWNEQTRKQIETNVHKMQAIDAGTLFVLRDDGTLSLRSSNAQSSPSANVALENGVRDFQAMDAQTVLVLDKDGKLWMEQGNLGAATAKKVLVAADVR